MATIHDLKPSFIELGEEEQIAIVKEVRRRRLETKPPRTKAIKERREKKSAKLSTLDKMSVDELDILIARLEASRGKTTEGQSEGS